MAMDRMEAQFRFTQGQSAFCASGSWDAMSFTSQVDFPMGIVDFPRPDRDDPEFGAFVVGRVSEADAPAVFRLAISRRAPRPDVALRFLHFLLLIVFRLLVEFLHLFQNHLSDKHHHHLL